MKTRCRHNSPCCSNEQRHDRPNVYNVSPMCQVPRNDQDNSESRTASCDPNQRAWNKYVSRPDIAHVGEIILDRQTAQTARKEAESAL